MKCPTCGAWSAVLETRDTRRRRECANGHRFPTLEVFATAEARRQVARDRTVQKIAARTWARNQHICSDPRNSFEVGKAYGLSAPMVRKIRRLAKQPRTSACARHS